MDPVVIVLVCAALATLVAVVSRGWGMLQASQHVYYPKPEPKTEAATTECDWCGDIAGREFNGRSFGVAIRDRWEELIRERDESTAEKDRWRQRAAISQAEADRYRLERNEAQRLAVAGERLTTVLRDDLLAARARSKETAPQWDLSVPSNDIATGRNSIVIGPTFTTRHLPMSREPKVRGVS